MEEGRLLVLINLMNTVKINFSRSKNGTEISQFLRLFQEEEKLRRKPFLTFKFSAVFERQHVERIKG
jgi:hypothetical protein